MKIDVILPADRTKTGTLTLYGQDGHIIAGPYSVQGKGTSNSGPMAPNGDTPTGDYVLPDKPFMGPGTSANDIKRFGTHSRIVISPVSGDAAAAIPTRNMDTIRIHGGSPNPTTGGLRWTQGCLRLSNDDMLGLLNGLVIGALEATDLTVATGISTDMALPSVDVSVSEEDIDPPQEAPDPQPSRFPMEAQPPKTGKETKEGKDSKEGSEGKETKEGSEGKETKEGSEGSESKEESDGKEGESDGSENSENKEGESDGSEDSESKEGESDGSEGSEGKEESDGKEGESDGKEGFDGPIG